MKLLISQTPAQTPGESGVDVEISNEGTKFNKQNRFARRQEYELSNADCSAKEAESY
jgi:hypothetical protein